MANESLMPGHLVRFCGADCGPCDTYKRFLSGDESALVNPDNQYRCCWLPKDYPRGRDCEIRTCCEEKGILFCGECSQFETCLRMKEFYSKPGEVGFTITSLDEEVQRVFEPHSLPASARLAALAELSGAGVKTWAFCGPLLPFLSDGEKQMDTLFGELAGAGVSYIIVDSIKLSGAIWGKVRRVLERHHPDLMEGYRYVAANRRPYHEALMARARELAERHGLTWGE